MDFLRRLPEHRVPGLRVRRLHRLLSSFNGAGKRVSGEKEPLCFFPRCTTITGRVINISIFKNTRDTRFPSSG